MSHTAPHENWQPYGALEQPTKCRNEVLFKGNTMRTGSCLLASNICTEWKTFIKHCIVNRKKMEVWELRHRSRNDHTYCHSQRLTGSLVLPVSAVSATGDFAALGLLFPKGSILLPGGTSRNPMNYKLSLLPRAR